jgi:hypothetical protein
MDAAAVARLEAYFAQIGSNLRHKRRRESFAMYASASSTAASAVVVLGGVARLHLFSARRREG